MPSRQGALGEASGENSLVLGAGRNEAGVQGRWGATREETSSLALDLEAEERADQPVLMLSRHYQLRPCVLSTGPRPRPPPLPLSSKSIKMNHILKVALKSWQDHSSDLTVSLGPLPRLQPDGLGNHR